MSSPPQKPLKTRLSPARIAAIYVLVGGLWIILSSFWVSSHSGAPDKLLHFEIGKGLFYVAFTAAILWWLCRSWFRQISQAVAEQESAQSKYATYIKSSPIAISVIDTQGRILETNAANEKLTGYSCAELETMTIFDLDRTNSPEETAKVFADIFEKGSAVQMRVIQRKDGTHLDIKVDGVHLNDGKAICFSRDITERIQYERKLLMLNAMLRAIRKVNKAIVETSETEELLQKICDVLVQDRDFKHAWIALLDADGRAEHYCDAPKLADADKLKAFLDEGKLEDCLADTRQEDGLVVAKHPQEQCPDFPIMEGLEGCALLGMHFKYDNRDGYIALMANPEIVDDEEEISLFREVCGDLQYALHTIQIEREKTEAIQAMVQAKREAEDANQAKDDFLAVMSHEMRTPLNPIIGFAEMLLEDIDSEPEKSYARTILEAGNRQLDLVDNILHYMRLHRGNVKLSPANFHLRDLCESVIHDASTNAPVLELRLTDGAHGKPVPHDLEVVSDVQTLRAVLDNLIDNACKYTHEGHVHLDLSEATDSPGEFILTVEDSGMGIASGTIDRLFEAFNQADSSYTRRHEGVGLGLAICKKLVDLLKGQISVDSTLGEGSSFSVRLPFEPKLKSAAAKAKKERMKTATVRFDRPVEVLAVDDKPDNLFVIEKMLTRAGGRFAHAENGAVAVELCQEHKYEVILMDLAMPVMNGLDAAEAIRAKGLNMETPIIAVTADATTDARTRCEEAGMQSLLTKPIKMRELVEKIQEHIR